MPDPDGSSIFLPMVGFRISWWNGLLSFGFALLSGSTVVWAVDPIPGVANHWLANTGGTADNHVANFLTDMVVYYPPWEQTPQGPVVLTKSFWDEGGCGHCSYKDGAQSGKSEWWADKIFSDSASYHSKTCRIVNFWGRAFLNRNGPPPVGDSAPYVSCDGHDPLRSVVDPTALAFDMAGNLLVADNGPDQNVKIFLMVPKKPVLLRTFGDSGGVFAGPVPGKVGNRRFWGIRGLGVDSQGNVYVGNTGIPEQTMGGTDIRVFSGIDSSMLWQVQGLAFVNTADADPASDVKSVFLNAKRFEMDWTRPPGQSWRLAGVTLDPYRYPSDPRIIQPMESPFIRRIGGKLFQFTTGMYADFIAIHRFEPGSEIAIPAGFISLRDANIAWMADSAPTYERNEQNKRVRWYWFDRNGDGIPQRSEFGLYDNFNVYSQSLDVSEQGDIWVGGEGAWSEKFRSGGAVGFKFKTVNEFGVPIWDLINPTHLDIPFPIDSAAGGRFKYLAERDVMFVGLQSNYFIQSIRRYDHWSDPAQRKLAAVFNLGYNDNKSTHIQLDSNSAKMTLPMSFTADSDFVYVAYVDLGRDARVRGEITVYDAHDGHEVGWIAPGPETGFTAGAVDILYGLNVRTKRDGRKVLFVEEDGFGKVNAYLWCPEGRICKEPDPPKIDPPPGPGPDTLPVPGPDRLRLRRGPHGLNIQAPTGSAVELWSTRGQLFWRGDLTELAATDSSGSWFQVPSRGGNVVYAVLRNPLFGRKSGSIFVR